MGTVSKSIADRIIAGEYPEDGAVKIIKYTNAWGGEAYGVVCAEDNPDKYHASEYIIDPEVYWTLKGKTK